MHVCMCVCMCILLCTYIWTHTHTYTKIFQFGLWFFGVWMYVCQKRCMCVCVYCVCVCMYMYAYMHNIQPIVYVALRNQMHREWLIGHRLVRVRKITDCVSVGVSITGVWWFKHVNVDGQCDEWITVGYSATCMQGRALLSHSVASQHPCSRLPIMAANDYHAKSLYTFSYLAEPWNCTGHVAAVSLNRNPPDVLLLAPMGMKAGCDLVLLTITWWSITSITRVKIFFDGIPAWLREYAAGWHVSSIPSTKRSRRGIIALSLHIASIVCVTRTWTSIFVGKQILGAATGLLSEEKNGCCPSFQSSAFNRFFGRF